MVMLGSYPGGGTSKYNGDSKPEFSDRYVEVLDGITTGTGAAIGAGVGAVVGGAAGALLSGTSYDAYKDYVNAVARSDARLEPGASNEETIDIILAAGWVPIYCSDSVGTRDNILREFKARGWQGKGWGQSYSKGGGQKSWWYGATFKAADAPAAIVQRGILDPARVKTLLVDAKHWMRSYGGTENYDEMIALAIGAALLARQQERVISTPSTTPPTQQTPPTQPVTEERMASDGPTTKPFYKTWWFWTIIGTAVVTTGGIGGYLIYRKAQAPVPAAAGLGTFRPRGCLCSRKG